jgi:hypothetical protein
MNAARSGHVAQSANCFRACAKQTPANGFLDKCQSLLRLVCLCFGSLRTDFRRSRLGLSGTYAHFSLRQGSRGVLQFAVSIDDNLSQRVFRGCDPLFGVPQPFRRVLAHCLGASFDLSRAILDTAENFSGLIHQIKRPGAGPWRRGSGKIQYVFIPANGRPSFLVCHEEVSACVRQNDEPLW